MSRVQTQVANDRMKTTRDKRKYEVWQMDPSKMQDHIHATEAGEHGTNLVKGGMTEHVVWFDLQASWSAHGGRTLGSYSQHQEPPPVEREILPRRTSTERHRTLSTGARPLDNRYNANAARLRQSVEHDRVYAQEEDWNVPYDSRHLFQEAIPDRRIRSEAEIRLSACMKEKKGISELLENTVYRLEDSNRKNKELLADVGRLEDELEGLKSRLRESEERHRKTTTLLRETILEVRGAEYYVTKSEAVSDADIVTMIDSLNAEIMQTAALMADSLGYAHRRKGLEGKVDSNERSFNQRALGSALFQYLGREGETVEPMAVQLALQFCIVETCYVVVESWRPGDWRGEEILKEVYTSLKKTAIQAVFGRWRALTRSQTKYQENASAVYSYLYRRIEDVLSLAGWPRTVADNQKFLEMFKERLERIVALSLRIHKASSEDMTSGEVKSRMIYPEEKYDSAAMDEAFPDETDPSDATGMNDGGVAGTTDLGLVRVVGNDSRALRKPKVVLVSAMKALLAEFDR